MKLCEAMVGQDLMGFHPWSLFRGDCTDGAGNKLYSNNPLGFSPLYPTTADNLRARKEPYLQADSANAYKLSQLFPAGRRGVFEASPDLFVLCDVYTRVKNLETGKGVGMPILYYKANTSNTIHDPCGTTSGLPAPGNDNGYIYNYLDNHQLVLLGLPWDAVTPHPLSLSSAAPSKFYEITKDNRVSIATGWPYRPKSYILISAGFDGMYGTSDDIFNFEK
jgi:hypothetical protein